MKDLDSYLNDYLAGSISALLQGCYGITSV